MIRSTWNGNSRLIHVLNSVYVNFLVPPAESDLLFCWPPTLSRCQIPIHLIVHAPLSADGLNFQRPFKPSISPRFTIFRGSSLHPYIYYMTVIRRRRCLVTSIIHSELVTIASVAVVPWVWHHPLTSSSPKLSGKRFRETAQNLKLQSF